MASSSGSGGGGQASDPTSPPSGSGAEKATDGWDNEEWGSLEEEPEGECEITNSDAWSPGDAEPILPDQPASLWTEGGITNRKVNAGWDDTEFEPLEETPNINPKLEEAKKKREERKLMRQKELEARRAGRNTGGPMKLGAKKI